MPYKARRHQLEGNLVYHVLNRANFRLKIFHDDEDYEKFKAIIKRYSTINEMMIYNYCIMPNHYHILLEIKDPEKISRAIGTVNRLYSVYYHKKNKTSGYLWQGRFKSKAVQKDKYLLSCGRYIERNPVTCSMVEVAEEYLYSSARKYVLGAKDELVTESPLYESFGIDQAERKEEYGRFLQDFNKEEEKEHNRFDVAIGNEEFKKKLFKKDGRFLPKRKGR